MKHGLFALLIIGWMNVTHAEVVTYNFNFSTGGTGTFEYDTVTGAANPINVQFGVLGSTETDFSPTATATILGSPPDGSIKTSQVFIGLQAGDGSPSGRLWLYGDGTYCVYSAIDTSTCVVTGTYGMTPTLPPGAYSGTYSFNFSTGGSGYFTYDGELGAINDLRYDFGEFGEGATDFGSSLTATVFGNPPGPAVIQNNTFFVLVGPAYGMRLNTDGVFCIRPDAGICSDPYGGPDLLSGTYEIALVQPGELDVGGSIVATPEVIDESGQMLDEPINIVLTFDQVSGAGDITVEVLATDSVSAPELPQGFQLAGTDVLYDITTTAEFTDNVEVCVGYEDAGIDEAALRLYHLHDGVWSDITNEGSPDTTINVICGTTPNFSVFVPVLPPDDSDADGLTDEEEAAVGTDPFVADTDNDGLDDGVEVNDLGTDPLNIDTDSDTLTDGEEVNLGTNPQEADTDYDGVDDASDPSPLIPGVTSGFLEDEVRLLSDEIQFLPLDLIDGRNDRAKEGRRNAMANKLNGAANEIAKGDYASALEGAYSLLAKLDDASSPPDWMQGGEEK